MTKSDSNALELRPYRPADLEDCMRIWTAASRAGHPFLSPDDIAFDERLVRETYMPMAQITLALQGRHVVGFEAERRAAMSVEVYEDNAKARAFYEALGFAQTGRRDGDDRGRAHALVQMESLATGAL